MTRHLHFIGVGGAGMSGLAAYWAARGENVTGSDVAASPTLEAVRAAGVDVWVGHEPERISSADVVVVSSAVPEDDPERLYATTQGIPVQHRSECLHEATKDSDVIAVSGTHGKTTTSAMVASALKDLGVDPSYVIGSTLPTDALGGHAGKGSVFVIEADESDGSFTHYQPLVAVVTNIEPDHLDFYGSEKAYVKAFDGFADSVRPEGSVLACSDDTGAVALTQRHTCKTYGTRSNADYCLNDGTIRDAEVTVPIHPSVLGHHNALNATGAYGAIRQWALTTKNTVDPTAIANAVSAFTGVARRFEFKGEAGGVRIYDDYAHHPTEISAVLESARSILDGNGRILAVFQPHLYSRTQLFANEFAQALSLADLAIVTDVYGAREAPVEGVDGALITQPLKALGSDTRQVSTLDDALTAVTDIARSGDIILTIGAGDITTLGPRIVDRIREGGRAHG